MTAPIRRLEVNDRVTDMTGRDGTVAEIDEGAALRLCKVQFDEGGAEVLAEGMLERRPQWGGNRRVS